MTRRRWIADEVSDAQAALTGSHALHLSRVLRARVGQQFDIATGTEVRRGTILAVTDHRVEFSLGELLPADVVSQFSVALSIFKFDRMEWAIEKCTELGISRIIPVIARRTEGHLATAAAKRVDRWKRIALQASEQSRRISPPQILEPLKSIDAAALFASLRIVLSEAERNFSFIEAFLPDSSPADVLLAIGPEGGWTEEELKAFRDSGWTSASLGPTILRAETAAIAALAICAAGLR